MHTKKTFFEIEYSLNTITKEAVDQEEFQINELRIIKRNY